jgi:hypothetical protein
MIQSAEHNRPGDRARERAEWEAEFAAAARRPLAQRMRYAFVRTYKPVLDDAGFRSFDTMDEYRRWCEANLPSWLGYARI